MHPEISGYISSASYDNQLLNAPEVLEYEYVTAGPSRWRCTWSTPRGCEADGAPRCRRGPAQRRRGEVCARWCGSSTSGPTLSSRWR